MKSLVDLVNEKEKTDISYVRESYGYEFSYQTPKAAIFLDELKKRNGL